MSFKMVSPLKSGPDRDLFGRKKKKPFLQRVKNFFSRKKKNKNLSRKGNTEMSSK
tara:strand:- start:530 stop:694 length:165 start_codon:yes stop_codon:yes gene_type:complete